MEIKDAATALSALGQETRLAVLQALVRAGPVGRTPSDLKHDLSVPAPTLSFHLKDLAAARLIRSERRGRNIFYAADYGGLRALIDFLMTECCQGDPRLVGPYVVRTGRDA